MEKENISGSGNISYSKSVGANFARYVTCVMSWDHDGIMKSKFVTAIRQGRSCKSNRLSSVCVASSEVAIYIFMISNLSFTSHADPRSPRGGVDLRDIIHRNKWRL